MLKYETGIKFCFGIVFLEDLLYTEYDVTKYVKKRETKGSETIGESQMQNICLPTCHLLAYGDLCNALCSRRTERGRYTRQKHP